MSVRKKINYLKEYFYEESRCSNLNYWQKLAPILVFIIIIGIIIALGAFNKRLEHAIAFSFLLSAITFIFFFPH